MNNKNELYQDLAFFKNDILLDLRKIEERFNIKLTEQSVISSDQYDSFDKKLSELSERITKVQSLILDNSELNEKIKTFVRFKTRAEDNLNRMNAKIFTIQKENGSFVNNIEKIINDNLKYPGIIGNNSKFLNFRYFIDYTMKNFNDLNEFRDEIKSYNFSEFKRKINKDISDFRFTISDNYVNSVRLISNNFKKFDTKVGDIIKKNNKFMIENEAKFEEIKNNINKYFSEIQTKFESLKNNLNEKYKVQFDEIENLKDIKNELVNHINESKSFLEKMKSSNNNIDNNSKDTNISRNYIKNENKNNIQFDNNNNNNILLNKNEELQISVNLGNNNINISENYKNDEGQNDINILPNKNLHQIIHNRSKSFENLQDISIANKEETKQYDTYYNTFSKENRGKNYSISNIANIKLNKVILPEDINKRKLNRASSNLLSESKRTLLISNDLSSTITQKRMHLNDNINNMKKSSFDITKFSRQRKNKNINISHSVRFTNRKVEIKNPKIMNSLIIIKQKSKNNIYKNLDSLKRGKKNNLSFEKENNLKDEQTQIGFRKTFNLKNKIKELILMNSRNFKKNRKIQI